MRVFRLKRDTPFYKKGALYMSDIRDGSSCYSVTENYCKYGWIGNVNRVITSAESIEEQPDWFEEVFQVLPDYATREEIKAMNRGK